MKKLKQSCTPRASAFDPARRDTVLSDLTASYAAGSRQIVGALRDLERETGRTAMNLEPVRMNTDEFYQILRKWIFETLPAGDEIEEVAQGYAQAVRDAKQMDVTNASPESFAARIVDSYPFHRRARSLAVPRSSPNRDTMRV